MMSLMVHQIRPIVNEQEKMRGLLAFEVCDKQCPFLSIVVLKNKIQ